MLAFLTRRRVHSPLRFLRIHARSLNTLPKALPSYVESWNPTQHSRFHVSYPASNAPVASPGVVKHDGRRAEREQQRDTQKVTIHEKNDSVRAADQRHAIEQLNDLLRRADTGEGETADLSPQIWQAYCSAKNIVPGLLSDIPERAWDVLWASQDFVGLPPHMREINLSTLYQDMATVGKSSTVGSRTAYLEQKFLDGEEEQALAEWEADHASAGPGARQDYKPEHLETGAKLYALAGNADRAREVMEELYELYPTWNPSVMMHVFRVHTDTDSDQHRAEAWKIYINMRRLMLKSLTLDHYDAWFVGFLEARHVRYAKLVFRDMIKGGFLAASSSPNDIEATLRRFHLLTRLGTDIERITSLSLQAITTLPSVYHLHVFGYWMEAAVKFIAPQAAANILDMMFTRNYRPGTTHFNLFLRALLRTQEAQQVTKAENIGWRMIEETRVARSDRKSPISASEIIFSRYSTIVEPVLDSDAARKVPQANVTTFALIMQHHAAREQWEHVEYLARRLKESETFPNSTLMNVLMNNACRKGKFTEAWKLYKSLTNVPEDTPGVFPDGASIRCVWKMLRLALGNESTRDDPELPRPRQLLAETISWWHLCRSRHDSEQFRTGLAAENKTALTNLVMHCFSYTEDIAGSLVALHAMRRYLHIFPTDDVAYILQRQAAWVDMQREEPAVRARYNLNKMRRETLAKLAGVYDILLQKRLERLGYTGDEEYARMSDDEIGDHGLNLLSEFVRVVMKRTYEPDVVEAMIQQAKEDAGVPDMATGDLTAFEVA